jgi:hypothetical protein
MLEALVRNRSLWIGYESLVQRPKIFQIQHYQEPVMVRDHFLD